MWLAVASGLELRKSLVGTDHSGPLFDDLPPSAVEMAGQSAVLIGVR